MNTDAHRYDGPHAQLTFAIIGAAMEVLNELGAGVHEKPYENALVVEFGLRGIRADQQRRPTLLYKGVQVGEFVPDLIADDAVVVDAKVIDRVTDLERGTDAKLPAHHRSPSWTHPQLQAPEIEVGAVHPLTSSM